MARLTGGSLAIDSPRETEAVGGRRGAESLTRLARVFFAPKQLVPAPPGAPQRAGFGLGPPALFSAQAGENRAPGGATGPFFQRRRKKTPGEAFLGARLEMPLHPSIANNTSS